MVAERTRSVVSVTMLTAAVLLGTLSSGCKCETEKKKPVEPPQAAVTEPALPADVDAKLLDALSAASANCKAIEGQARVDCQGGEKNALVLSFNKDDAKRSPALPTFAYALTSGDENLKAVSASILYAAFRTGLGHDAKRDAVPKKVAQDLLSAALALPDSSAMQVIPAATHALMLSDQAEVLYDALEKDVAIQIKTMAYRYMMVYGRLPAFEKVRALGKDPGAAIVLAAVESPRNMPNWTKEEQAAICPWALGLLDDARPPVAGNAAAVLSKCAGPELDALLDQVAAVLKTNQFSYLHATALRDICGDIRKTRPEKASDAQCERVRKLQLEAARDADLEGRVRAMALSTMAQTWPDEQSYKAAEKLTKEKDAGLSQAAQQIVTRLAPQIASAKKTQAAPAKKSP